MQEWGYEVFATILLPGAVVALAGWLVVSEAATDSALGAWLSEASGEEWKFFFVLAIASTLFGHILAAVAGFLEEGLLDKLTAWQLEIPDAQFEKDWDAYIDWLSWGSNSFVSRTARRYWAESRMGLGFASLAGVLAWWPDAEPWMTIGATLTAVALLALAARTHEILAGWRRRNFAAGTFEKA